MRLELRDGQWADLRERIDHGAHKRIKVAIRKGSEDDALAVELDDVVIREFVTAWNVLDLEDNAIPLGELDRVPSDIADALLQGALDAYQGASVPNPPTGS